MELEAIIPAIAKAAWQPKIFAARPRRSELLALKPSWPCREVRLRVHRNMPFEFTASALPAYLAYAGLKADIAISDYDDALNFKLDGKADCELVWLDYARYAGKQDARSLAEWVKGRLLALRASSTAPILIADGGEKAFDEALPEIAAAVPGCRVFPRRQLQAGLGQDWIDARVKDIGASSMSDAANLIVAQQLGLVWVPGAVSVALKALVLDLDRTLYEGVLGEDGVQGVHLTEAHRELQEKIRALKEQGIFLALLSRNEKTDVEKLFAARTDFPLRWQDFSAACIGWQEKTEGIGTIAKQLRIHEDAMLMLDDNLGEVGKLAQVFPDMPILYSADPEMTCRALDLFPRLLRWHQDRTDQLRTDDMKAAEARTAAMASAPDPIGYMKSLAIRLQFWLDPEDLRGRLADLANKTNQFALALPRFNETEVARRLHDPSCATVAVGLADKLSDSGVIAAIFCHTEDHVLNVDEICVSCRALGRGVEDLMILTALARMREKLPGDQVAFAYRRGPRNDPARSWLEKLTDQALPDDQGKRRVAWADLHRKLLALPVTIVWESKEKAA